MGLSKKNSKLIQIEILSSVVLLLLLITGMSNIWTDVFALSIYLLSIFSMFMVNTSQVIKYFSFILGSSWAIVAVFFMENAVVTVGGDKSHHYGSFSTYVLSWIVYYLTILLVERKNQKKDIRESKLYLDRVQLNKNKVNTIRIIVFAATVLEMIAFLSICTKPYFLYAVDRVVYANTVLPSWLNGHIGFFAIIIPLAVLIIDDDKFLSFLYIGLYFLINLWVGEKFTGQIVGIYFFVFSYIGLYGHRIKAKTIKRIIYAVAIVVLLMLAVVYFQIKVVGGRNFEYYLTERISAQGYIWWLTYSNNLGKGMRLNELGDELVHFFTQLSGKMSDYDFGIYKLMKLYYEPTRWMNMLDYGFRGTESTRATFYYYGKIPGLIIGQIVLGLMTSKIVNLCFKYLKRLDYIRVFFAFYILRNFLSIYSMSDFYLLLKPLMIVSYLVLLFRGNLNLVIVGTIPKLRLGKNKL